MSDPSDDLFPRTVAGDLAWMAMWAAAIVVVAWLALCWAGAYV